MKLSFLNRFLNIFALILHLTTICSGAGVLLKKGKSAGGGCRFSSLKKLQSNIVRLECEELNRLQNFTELIPEGAKVTEINMYTSNFTVLVENSLYKMDLLQLENLRICYGNLEKIEDGAFKGGDTIQELDFSGNSIESLDPVVFRFLPNLDQLRLTDNKLKQFAENGVFPNEKLRDLSLDGNEIEKLNPNLFSKSKDLSVLLLNNNQLKILDVKIFPPNISFVSLFNNPWECNCEFKAMMELLREKENLHSDKSSSITCSSKGSIIHAYDSVYTKFSNLSRFCTPQNINQIEQTDAVPTKLNTPDTNSNKIAESNHICCIVLVIGMAVLAGVGYWFKKRTTVENGRVKFVTMTENED